MRTTLVPPAAGENRKWLQPCQQKYVSGKINCAKFFIYKKSAENLRQHGKRPIDSINLDPT